MRIAKTVVSVVLVVGLAVTVGVMGWRWPRSVPIAAAETVLVYSPHPDDETYGMGAAIAEQVLAGRRVVGVLVTDGEGSADVPDWVEGPGIDMDADGDVDLWDFGLARRTEYQAAMRALGVTELVFLGAAGAQGVDGFRDGEVDGRAVGSVLADTLAAVLDGGAAAHMTVAKYNPEDRLRSEPREHPDHTAIADAVLGLAESRGDEAFFYKTYVLYGDHWWERWSRVMVQGSDEAQDRKQAALQAYVEMGRDSTPELWYGARDTDVEYLGVVVGR